MRSVEAWLIRIPRNMRRRNPTWIWGCDTFWMAFTATFPAFPQGTWDSWNPAIPMEGHYIEYFLSSTNHNRLKAGFEYDAAYIEVVDNIWKRLQIHIWSLDV
jgi:hypothetical protein